MIVVDLDINWQTKKVVKCRNYPARGVDFEKFLDHCPTLQDAGIEFVNIPDGARAMARMGSFNCPHICKNHFDLEPIPHLTTRDRNLLGLQGDLLGSCKRSAEFATCNRRSTKLGNCPGASVYDVDAIGLTSYCIKNEPGIGYRGSSFWKTH